MSRYDGLGSRNERFIYWPLADQDAAAVERHMEKFRYSLSEVNPELLKRFDRGELTILDIGAGKGSFAAEAEKLGNKVIALDANTFNERRATLHVRGDAEQLPFADQTFDIVTSTGPTDWEWHPTSNVARIYKESARVLKPHGYFVDLYAWMKSNATYHDYMREVAQLTEAETKEILENDFDDKSPTILQKKQMKTNI